MCAGVRYTINNETVRGYFPNPQAQLPRLNSDFLLENNNFGLNRCFFGLKVQGWRYVKVL